MGQLTHLVYYYLKDLDQVHFACRGLPYGDKNQTLFINDESSKALQNPKWSGLFLKPFRRHELSKNKVQWLNLAFLLWMSLKGLPFAKTIYAHFAVIMQFSRLPFNFQYPSYSWFKQYEGSSSRDPTIMQLSLGDILSKHFPSLFQLCFPCLLFHVGSVFYFYFIFCKPEVCNLEKFQLFIFVCGGFCSLFTQRHL
jgi:hypothetical protein